MVTEIELNKKEILLRIIGSGINISPNALEMLFKSHVTTRDIENIIRQISYLSNFKSQITLDVLRKTNYYEQMEENIKKKVEKTISSNPINKENVNLQQNNSNVTKQNHSNPNKISQKEEQKRKREVSEKNSIIKSEIDSLKELTDLEKASETNIEPSKKTLEDISTKSDQKSNNLNHQINSIKKNYAQNNSEVKNISSEKIKSKYHTDSQSGKRQDFNKKSNQGPNLDVAQKPTLDINQNQTHEDGTRLKEMENRASKLEFFSGTSTFQPIAKDYSEQVSIKMDPTSNLFTGGSIEDFVSVVRDKYNKLKSILMKNPEVQDAKPIKNILSMQNSDTIGLIGMVKEKVTLSGEKKNIRLKLEDLTGEIGALVINDERNRETYNKMIYLLNDQVVYISGYLKIDQKRKSRIIFANKVVWPDIPIGYRAKIPNSPVSIALISDVHIGSKNFLPKLFDRFVKYLRCEIGNEKQRKEAGRIKYLVIGGDLVDGIGIYPDQEKELDITDIYQQYSEAARLLSDIPDYIKIIYSPGNHEPVRNAIPHPSIPKKYCEDLINQNITLVGNPCYLNLHGIDLLTFHGDSLIDINVTIPGLSNDNPELAMNEYLRCRHLAPMYGAKTEIAPMEKDWLVIEEIPHVFHTGHVHINGLNHYRGVLNVNSGCFQSQTSFMKSLGIVPTPGYPVIISPENGKLNAITINLND